MKDIMNYNADKYSLPTYEMQETGIYKHGHLFVTSFCFQQEPGLGEGSDAGHISQYPLEDILERFFVYITDFYEDLNTSDSQICYLEFGSPDIFDIRKLREVIGKHIYNRSYYQDGKTFEKLIIE